MKISTIPRKTSKSTSKAPAIRLNVPRLECSYLDEPQLEFANGRQNIDPKLGILRFGPKSLGDGNRHPSRVRVGLIGTAEGIEVSQGWIDKSSLGVSGDDKHLEFPGFAPDRGFFAGLDFHQQWTSQITRSEIDDIFARKTKRERFEQLLQLLDSKLASLCRKDLPPQYIVLSVPADLYNECHIVDYNDKTLGQTHRDLRRAFKALAMRYRIPTQILREKTAKGLDNDHYSKITWNFFTGLYFKAGGFPWAPVGLLAGTCHLGISFYRSLGSKNPKTCTSMVQAFDEHGQGLVLRGPDFEWDADREGTNSPHLSEADSARIVELALTQYSTELGQIPKRVVVHKTSRFWEMEQRGFQSVLGKSVQRYDLVALHPQNTVRLMPLNNYPALRGTRFSIENLDFLYTTGFIAELGQFHGMHVPSPLEIADHIGRDTSRNQILKEILVLTKMNWNSAHLGGLLPITLRFSRLVGNILKEMPEDIEPLTNYKFYT